MPTTDAQPLLTPDFMHQLDRLDVLSRKVLMGRLQGERRSKKRGQSVEFADYRPYVAGDDLRFIDWNLYARLDRLFLRLFMEEEDLSVSIVMDVSRSMDYGQPSKLRMAQQLAAALGYIGLTHYNRVSVLSFSHAITGQLLHMRGRRPLPRMLEFLADQQPADLPSPAGNLEAACRQFALLQRGKGIVILISDFLDKGDLSAALRYLDGQRYDTYVIHLLSPEEIDPGQAEIAGDLRLRDVEDGDIAEVSVTSTLIKRYKANLEAFCQHVRDTCLKRQIAYLFADTSVPFEDLVLRYLRQRGLLG